MSMTSLYLKRGKEESLKRFHPWIFSGAVQRIDGNPNEGEIVDVYTSEGYFIAKGHWQIGSIAVRVLTFENEDIDIDFWKTRLQTALNVRRSIGVSGVENNNTYRLVHGEGDFLPGLIVDIYGNTAVIQAHSPGMHFCRDIIAAALTEIPGLAVKNVYYKSETTLPYKAHLDPQNAYIIGDYSGSVALENGLSFNIDWLRG